MTLSLPASVPDREVGGVVWEVAHPFVVLIVDAIPSYDHRRGHFLLWHCAYAAPMHEFATDPLA